MARPTLPTGIVPASIRSVMQWLHAQWDDDADKLAVTDGSGDVVLQDAAGVRDTIDVHSKADADAAFLRTDDDEADAAAGKTFNHLALATIAFRHRPWVDVTHRDFGAKADDATANAVAFQSALDLSSASKGDVPLMVPPGGVYLIEDTLQYVSGSRMCGFGAHGSVTSDPVDGAPSILRFVSSDDTANMIETIGTSRSLVELSGLRLEDERAVKTAGSGVFWSQVKNYVRVDRVSVHGFPDDQVYIGAPSGQSSDELHITDLWGSGGRYVLNLDRLDNNALIQMIRGTALAADVNGGLDAVINIGTIGGSSAHLVIQAVKAEGDNGAHVLRVAGASHGTVSAHGMSARGAGPLGDILHVAAGDGSLITAEGLHGTSQVNLVNIVDTSETITGSSLPRWVGGISGDYTRTSRHTAGTGSPNGAVLGNRGDSYSRIDGAAGSCWYVKETDGGSSGWQAK